MDVQQVGVEWLVEATGCSPLALADVGQLQSLLGEIVADLELNVVGQLWRQFPDPGGVTGMLLLAESHLTCHTFPECGLATFNLYCCRGRPDWPWDERLATAIGASAVRVRRVARGEMSIAPAVAGLLADDAL